MYPTHCPGCHSVDFEIRDREIPIAQEEDTGTIEYLHCNECEYEETLL